MDEKPPSPLRRPWNTPGRIVAWLLLLAVSTFAVICASVLLADHNVRTSDLIRFALVLSVVIALGGVSLVWFFRWVRSWKNFRRFLFVAACLVTLILLAYAEENRRGKRAWQKHRQYWEAKGEKFRLAEFVPLPVPDDQNFALTPMLKPALEIMRQVPASERDTNGLARLDRTSAQLSGGPGKKAGFELGSPEKGTFADLASWAEFYRGNTNYPQVDAGASAAQVVLAALARTEPELKELRAAAARQYSRFPIAYDYEPSWAILLPHLYHIKGLTILMHVRSVAELESGHPQDAFEDLKLAFRLSDSIRTEPILISHLVRISTLNIAAQIVREGIARHAWNDAQLAEIEKYSGSINILAEYEHVMRGERAFAIEGVDYLRRKGSPGMPMDYPDADGHGNSTDSFRPMPSGWFYQNMLTISQIYQQFILPAVDSQTDRVLPDVMDKEVSTLARMRAGPYTIFAKLLLPALQRAIVRSARAQTSVDAAHVACALERHQLAKGNLPAALDGLVPAFLDRVPNDVIDGRPLRYRIESNGRYLLYSIGWNRTDDGGQLAWTSKPASQNRLDETEGDWVWMNLPQK